MMFFKDKTNQTKDKRAIGGESMKYFRCGDHLMRGRYGPQEPWHRVYWPGKNRGLWLEKRNDYLYLMNLLLPLAKIANDVVKEYRPDLFKLMKDFHRGKGSVDWEESWEKRGITGVNCYRCPALIELDATRSKSCDCSSVGLEGGGLFGLFHLFKVVIGPTLFHFDGHNAFVFLFPIDQPGYNWGWDKQGKARSDGLLGGGLQLSLGYKSVGFSYLPGDGVLFDSSLIAHGSRMYSKSGDVPQWLAEIELKDQELLIKSRRKIGLFIIQKNWLSKHGALEDWKRLRERKKESLNGVFVNDNRILKGGPQKDKKKREKKKHNRK